MAMPQRLRLLRQLADGRFHSGEELAAEAGVSRAAVWKQLQRLRRELDLPLHAVRGRGYRLADAVELLDRDAILARLASATRERIGRLSLHPSIDSTSAWLLRHMEEAPPGGWACLAEQQTAGRGRRGRRWVTPFGAGVALSLLWHLPLPPVALQGLSLALGVAVREALAGLGAAGIGLKWPNDLEVQGEKLAGILIDLAGEAEGPSRVVVGVGVNVALPPGARQEIRRPCADLAGLMGAGRVSRNAVAAALLEHLVAALETFAAERFPPFREGWQEGDAYLGRRVRIQSGGEPTEGWHRGVDDSGALLLETPGGLRRFVAGEVTLRGG